MLWPLGVLAWVFVVGAAIGSFLNVVVYRLPAGLSIVHPPSHCPRCKHAIRFYDNLPIVSWLILRGRCRDCGARFSSRYAWVELFSGLTLASLVATGPAARFGNLADAIAAPGAAIAWGQAAFLATLLASIATAALIERDGHRPPWSIAYFALVVGIVAGSCWPALVPIEIHAYLPPFGLSGDATASANGLLGWTSICGLVAGLAIGAAALVPRAVAGNALATDRRALAWRAICGVYLGWQMTLVAVAFAEVLRLATTFILGRQRMAKPNSSPRLAIPFLAFAAGCVMLTRNSLGQWTTLESRIGPWWPAALFLSILLAAGLQSAAIRQSATR